MINDIIRLWDVLENFFVMLRSFEDPSLNIAELRLTFHLNICNVL